jgi:hypothetical protein
MTTLTLLREVAIWHLKAASPPCIIFAIARSTTVCAQHDEWQ